MSTAASGERATALPIRIAVPGPSAEALRPLVEERASARVGELAARLGVTRPVQLEVVAGAGPEDFAIDVGEAARGAAAAAVLARAVLATEADPLTGIPHAGNIAGALVDALARLPPGAAELVRWSEALACVVHDVVAIAAQDLLGEADLAAIEQHVAAALERPLPAELRTAIAQALEHAVGEMVAIGDHAQVAAVLASGIGRGLGALDLAERVIDCLRTRATEIRIHPEYLEDLLREDLATTDHGRLEVDDLADRVASAMAARTGLVGPAVSFVSDPSVAPGRIAAVVQRTDRVEWRGPPPGMVFEWLAFLGAGGSLEAARNPHTGQQVGAWRRGGPARHAATMDFVVDGICEALSQRAARHVDRSSILAQIAGVERHAPRAVAAVLERHPVDDVVRVARNLARERIPVDLGSLFEAWLGSSVVRTRAAIASYLDDRLVVDDTLDEAAVALSLARLEGVPRLLRRHGIKFPVRYLTATAAARVASEAPRAAERSIAALARRLPSPGTTPVLLLAVPAAIRTLVGQTLRHLRPDVMVLSVQECDAIADLIGFIEKIDIA